MAAGNSCRQATASQDVQILLLSCKNEKRKEKKIASKKVKKADGRDKEREEGRREEGKGKTGCVRVEPARFCYSHCSNFMLSLCSSDTQFEEAEPPHMYCDITNTSEATLLHTLVEANVTRKPEPSRILPAPLRTSRSDRFTTVTTGRRFCC